MPSETRPDCEQCAVHGSAHVRRRLGGISSGGCPTARREARIRNGYGPVRAQPASHGRRNLKLDGCTWSESCEACKLADNRLEKLVKQWELCEERGLVARRVRVFFGGDWMSQAEPLGHGGPGSKHFCWARLAKWTYLRYAHTVTDHKSARASCPHPPRRVFAYGYDYIMSVLTNIARRLPARCMKITFFNDPHSPTSVTRLANDPHGPTNLTDAIELLFLQ